MSTDQKKPETILIPPFSPDNAVLVGPFATEETKTYAISPFKVTISTAVKATHIVMGAEAESAKSSEENPSAVNSIAVLMDYLAKHPEDLQEIIAKLQGLEN